MSCFRKPDQPSRFTPDSNLFCHTLHSVKIGNLRSVSQAPFRFHSILSVQRQHGKTGAQAVTKWIKSCLLQCFGTFKMPILMFISILVFRPEGQIWNPVWRDTRIYIRRILNASRISKTQLNSCTISPS